MELHWLGRRWVEFGRGYTGYLAFMVNFATFITVLYSLNDFIQEQFKFQTFVISVVAVILPLAVLIGHLHFTKQYRNEMEIGIKENPYTFKAYPRAKEIISYKTNIIILKELRELTKDPSRYIAIDKAIELNKQLLDGKDSRDLL